MKIIYKFFLIGCLALFFVVDISSIFAIDWGRAGSSRNLASDRQSLRSQWRSRGSNRSSSGSGGGLSPMGSIGLTDFSKTGDGRDGLQFTHDVFTKSGSVFGPSTSRRGPTDPSWAPGYKYPSLDNIGVVGGNIVPYIDIIGGNTYTTHKIEKTTINNQDVWIATPSDGSKPFVIIGH